MNPASMCRALLIALHIACLPRLTEQASVTYQLREEQDSGTFVGNIERDMLLQGELYPEDVFNLKYTLSTAGNPAALLFTLNETSSTITTAERIDREAVCPEEVDCQVRLSIAVYKKGASLDLFRLWTAFVNINDINDNSPSFPQPLVSLSVPESVATPHTLHTSGALDLDTGGSNSVQEYSLSPPSPLFGLDIGQNPDGSTDLGIVIKQQLDREAQEFYQLRVTVTDGGFPQRTGSLTVNITVADVNDNRPQFFRATYNVTVTENVSPNEAIVQVSATDQDSGLNGQITYGFSSRVTSEVTTRLKIDADTGIISARGPIDYEEKKQYQFVVEAKDQGNPQLSGRAAVILRVQDANDNSPQININLIPGGNNLTEDEDVGKFIAHVSVSDRDSGQNSVVICSMQDDHFTLQKFYDHVNNKYKVLLSQPLDFEASPTHRVTITCRDSGQPPLANSTSFIVHVRDVNDNAPVFSQQAYSGSVVENQADMTSLLQVSAVDYDTGPGGQVDYYLDDTPNVTRLFVLDALTGELLVRSPLNREDRGQYRFHVLAVDRGSPALTASVPVVISVRDQNDEKPYFTRSLFDCYLMEGQPAGTRVGNVSAIDTDSKRHAQMRFSIVPGVGDGQLFSVDAGSGVLRSRAVLDREYRALYRFAVKVEDPQVPLFHDVANVTVQVLDDNDNPPVIHYPRDGNNSVNISYTASVGSLVAVVNATDLDDGVFGRLSYRIVAGDPSRLFDLNRRSGSLRVARSVVPADAKEHVLELEVTDGGNPPMFHNTELHVYVMAGNATLMAISDGNDKNILIVVVLVCVTAFLALAVLLTICLIRRIDQERQGRRSAAAVKAEEEKMFHLKNQDAFMMSLAPDSGARSSSESSATSSGKGSRKKEVSFSVDEGVDCLNTNCGSPGNTLTTFKSPGGNHRHLHGQERCAPVCSRPARGDTAILSHPMGHRVSADDSQLYTVQAGDDACQFLERLKRGGEDALSESSGETGTSDSGRGGSEEDCHSNRGSTTMDPDGPAVYPPVSLRSMVAPPAGTDSAVSARGRHQLGGPHHYHHQQPVSLSGRPVRQHSPHVSFSGNLQYLGESSSDLDTDFPVPPAPDLMVESPPPPAMADRNLTTFASPRTTGYGSVVHTHPGQHNGGYGGVATSLVKSSGTIPTPPLGLEGGRKRWGAPCSKDEDDRTTSTTSGSYVINPDDLRKEIDELILNDMIV